MINISKDINDGFLQQFSMYDKLKLMKLGNNVKKEQKRTIMKEMSFRLFLNGKCNLKIYYSLVT